MWLGFVYFGFEPPGARRELGESKCHICENVHTEMTKLMESLVLQEEDAVRLG